MNPKEAQDIFKGCVVSGTINAPDNYEEWHPGWKFHRQELLEYWEIAKTGIKQDLDALNFIENTLEQAIESFDNGQKEPGQSLMVKIYNALNMGPLR